MDQDTPKSARIWRHRFFLVIALLVVVPGLLLAYVALRFGGDAAIAYDDPAEHFKYGSTGGEHESGFPYGIFQALPQVCAQQLPGGRWACPNGGTWEWTVLFSTAPYAIPARYAKPRNQSRG
jgi:hypothetical protein